MLITTVFMAILAYVTVPCFIKTGAKWIIENAEYGFLEEVFGKLVGILCVFLYVFRYVLLVMLLMTCIDKIETVIVLKISIAAACLSIIGSWYFQKHTRTIVL